MSLTFSVTSAWGLPGGRGATTNTERKQRRRPEQHANAPGADSPTLTDRLGTATRLAVSRCHLGPHYARAVSADQWRGRGAHGSDVVTESRLSPLPSPPRKETSTIEFPSAAWTSFDRYARYGAIVRALRANLGPGRWRVLDVGDNSGWLLTFDRELVPISVDVVVNDERLEETIAVLGRGERLPIRDGAVDAVVSSDALEHVPPEHRGAFLCELARVSDLVIVAAPFDTPGVAGAEEFVQRYVMAATGAPQDQLLEHADHGLPSIDDTVENLRAAGLDVQFRGNGNLQDWLLGMVVKHQLADHESLDHLNDGFDVLYNMLLAARNDVEPYYRYVVVGRRGAAPAMAAAVRRVGGRYRRPVRRPLVAANVAEVTKRELQLRAADLAADHRVAAEHLMARFSGVEAALADLQHSLAETQHSLGETRSMLSSIHDLVRHPVRTVGRRVRRAGGDDPAP